MFRYNLNQFSKGNESYNPEFYFGFLLNDYSNNSRKREIEFNGQVFQNQDLIQEDRITTAYKHSIILEALKVKRGDLRVRQFGVIGFDNLDSNSILIKQVQRGRRSLIELRNFYFSDACSFLIKKYKHDKGISNSSIQELGSISGLLESGHQGIESRINLYKNIKC